MRRAHFYRSLSQQVKKSIKNFEKRVSSCVAFLISLRTNSQQKDSQARSLSLSSPLIAAAGREKSHLGEASVRSPPRLYLRLPRDCYRGEDRCSLDFSKWRLYLVRFGRGRGPDCWVSLDRSMKSSLKKGKKSSLPFRLSKTTTHFCLFPKVRLASQTSGDAPVYLNVYDLTPINGYMYWAGLGIFHTGVEVHGVEYAFGAHDYPTSGVFEVEPRQCPGYEFRKSIFMGTTGFDPLHIREFVEIQSGSYNGDTYHLITKNCNHFCQDICYKLTGNSIPKWVNRLARIGSLCNFILPEPLKITAVQHDSDSQTEDSEKQRLTTAFSCLSSISMNHRQLSTSSFFIPSFKQSLPHQQLRRSSSVPIKDA